MSHERCPVGLHCVYCGRHGEPHFPLVMAYDDVSALVHAACWLQNLIGFVEKSAAAIRDDENEA